ncbi:AIP3-domain-containing protein [Tilletiaria anomala UBC 951]|uniref:AIP3-domain-containing protein n=1 Tax=Tilletiaria anomala (strain ATCC 24038 / CBS 436.72 / UBC 951) TaxID=1037660 RepID=A0A066VXC3_TILAU|nr:AIP3-domain-containing protein [Tilletiaria anomala UBC 951]KDN46151.1 AIP3-domain-containing protein [Tilletiaria anomala UBC 951]
MSTLQAQPRAGDSAGQAGRYSTSHMESSVTRLLVATKMLLEALTKWSMGQRTEEQVSDVYVRLGNDFNTAKLAFGSYGIDMRDLESVPDDLRACLEACLSEEASQSVLEKHLPRVREIIIALLQGLKLKQAQYKQYLMRNRTSFQETPAAPVTFTPVPGPPPMAAAQRIPDSSRDSNTPKDSVLMRGGSTSQISQKRGDSLRIQRQGGSEGSPTVPQYPLMEDRPPLPSARDSLHRGSPSALSPSSSASRRPMHAPPIDTGARASQLIRGHLRRPSIDSLRGTALEAQPDEKRFSPTVPISELEETVTSPPPHKGTPHLGYRLTDTPLSTSSGGVSDTDVSPSVAARSRHAPSSSVPVVPQPPVASGHARAGSSASTLQTPTSDGFASRSPLPTIEATSPLSMDSIDSAADPSLRALKSRDVLERRASKRFSAYTFNKMGLGQGFGSSFGSGNLGMSMLNLGATPSGASGSAAPADRRVVQSERKTNTSKRPSRLNVVNNNADIPTGPQSGDTITSGPPSASGLPSRGIKSAKRVSSTSSTASSANRSPMLPSLSLPQSTERTSPSGSSRGRLSPAAESSTESLPFVDAAHVLSPTEDEVKFDIPPVPPLPTPAERARLDAIQNRASQSPSHVSQSANTSITVTSPQPVSAETPTQANYHASALLPQGQLNLFLQLGRHTRKAVIDYDPDLPAGGITIATLRMLFVNRFAYSPGQDDFPAIYIKDPRSGLSFELEDLEDIQSDTLLTLNIEPLDQVKQHLDLSISGLTRELRELKAAVMERDVRRMSIQQDSYAHVAESVQRSASQNVGKISDSEFAAAGQRVAQMARAASGKSPVGGGSPNSTGARAADELRVQYDELQKLRRELAIMRQVQGEFSTDVTSLFKELRERNKRVRKIATADAPVERNFIIAGKAQLDSSSQEVLTLVEDLQDTVDDLKHDVIQRGVKPKPAMLKKIVGDIEKATKGLEEVEKYVQNVKPSWKKTWESELQSIVEEQEFLNHQESLIADLRDDHAALQDVFNDIQQVVKLRGTSSRGYIPPAPEEGHQGLNTVMLEVRGQSVDHEKRLRALQAAEKQRQRELAGRTDEFADELAGFVDGKALRKTGGHLEAERIRQRRDKATLNAMFGNGDDMGGAPTAPAGPGLKPAKFILGQGQKEEVRDGGKSASPTLPLPLAD